MNFPSNCTHRPREAILLVAGSGRRLRPLTDDCPKCLLKVGESSLLQRLLEQLEAVGIERVVLATGHHHDIIARQARQWAVSLAVETALNAQYDETNNAVSLALAMDQLRGRRFLLCDGDILLRDTQPLERLLQVERDNVLSVMTFEELGEEEMKATIEGEDGRIQSLGKGLSPHRADGESMGIQKIGPSAYDALRRRLEGLDKRERLELYYEDVFGELIGEKIEFYACRFSPGGWTEIDTVEDLEEGRRMVERWGESPP